MPGEAVLRIQPGESVAEFTRRVVDSAPDAPPYVMDRIRTLLVPSSPAKDTTVSRQHTRAA
ncbi:hypothetical protein ABZ468_25640 [Streptomyces sp. NPDC005708]|uniref:hypothetical protein n=1 Tax=Streptomyces sp. NPDC005708 TaxID=3154564 RepID=UPI0033FAA8EB